MRTFTAIAITWGILALVWITGGAQAEPTTWWGFALLAILAAAFIFLTDKYLQDSKPPTN